MLEIAFYRSVRVSMLFVILIACVFLGACASHQSAPVTDKSRQTQWRPKTYVVVPGDTLFSIAWRYGLKYEDLARHNGIKAPYTIRPSQIIRLDLNENLKSIASAAQSDRWSAQKKQPPKSAKSTFSRQKNKTGKLGQARQLAPGVDAPQWRWPVKGVILSSFQSNNGLNKGIDLSGKLGEPVLAAASGQVVYAGSGLRGYGKLLIIKHNETFLSAYAHNERLRVKEGDLIKVGQVIADMGSSGTDRVKLHFEIRRDGTPVDPLKYLPRR
jgi:lipoprotein NlpD